MASLHHLPKRLVGVSTKMYFDLPTALSYITALRDAYQQSPGCGIFVVPSFLALVSASKTLQPTPHILLGAQDCHWEDSGAYTGEVSAKEVQQAGCTIVELGHAERRRAPFNESDEMVAKKAQAAIRNGLIPLICMGETRKSGIMSEGVGLALRECIPQITTILDVIPQGTSFILAYEPVWAIGAKEPASADHVLAVVGEIRRACRRMGRGEEVRILYGGSAGPGTWETLKGGVDGLFLGRFAHDVHAFRRTVDEVSQG